MGKKGDLSDFELVLIYNNLTQFIQNDEKKSKYPVSRRENVGWPESRFPNSLMCRQQTRNCAMLSC